jgi:glycosyltransferase involved in cell wall biosynthesis
MNQNLQESNEYELSIVMPCLNEEKTIGTCIKKAQHFLQENNIYGEIIVADNGSTDQSAQIAEKLGARVVHINQRGYGSAILGGIEAAQGKYIIMGDADDSYDFLELMPFVEKLREGYELVMGNRFLGGIEPGAMPPLHKYIGNPILSGIGRLFFRIPVKDFHCGLRGFSRESVKKLNLQTTGMEFASEMVIKASLYNLEICEVATTLTPDGRGRPPHLRTWRDGWRHLRFMLLYSPRWLFFYPGIMLIALGVILSIWINISYVSINNVSLDIHSLAYFNAFIVVGFSMVLFAFQSRIYGYRSGLIPNEPSFNKLYQHLNLERGLLLGTLMIGVGFSLAIFAFIFWSKTNFGDLDPQRTMRIVIPSITVFIMGTQVVFFSFFLSILGIRTSKYDN